jgi:hypothetical protein
MEECRLITGTLYGDIVSSGGYVRILLVSPPSGELTIGLKHLAKVEPLGLEIIGAALRMCRACAPFSSSS